MKKNKVRISAFNFKDIKIWGAALAIGLILLLAISSFVGLGSFLVGEKADKVDQDVFSQDPDEADDNWSLERSEEFFVEYRLERERVRSRELDLLQQMVNNPNTSSDSKREAEVKILELKDLMELELNVESSLVGLGYKHAILFYQKGSVNVVVNAEALTREEKAQIAELVSKAAGVERYQITIAEKGN